MNIDFNTVYELAAPYLGTSGIALLIIGLLYVFIKYRKVIKAFEKETKDFLAKIKNDFEMTENEALKAFKAALPQDLSINIEALTKQEMSAIKEYFISAINENWLKQITTNSELIKAMANALLSIKSIPDSSKKEIGEMLKLNDVQTTDKLKIELLAPVEDDVPVNEPVHKSEIISID